MIRKLRNNKGETITEVLVASLVVVLGVLLYAMMVNSSFHIINTAEEGMKKLYENESSLEGGTADKDDGKQVTFKNGKTDALIGGISSPDDYRVVDVTVYHTESMKMYEYDK